MKVSQGVTTVVAGNCGVSLGAVRDRQRAAAAFPASGSGRGFPVSEGRRLPERLRAQSAGVEPRASHRAQLAQGQCPEGRSGPPGQCRRTRRHGRSVARRHARGRDRFFSTGLGYPPAKEAPEEEIVALASVLREFDHSVYATHMRNEGDHVLEAVEETVRTGRAAGVQTVISHHKCAGPPQLRPQHGNAGGDRGGAAGTTAWARCLSLYRKLNRPPARLCAGVRRRADHLLRPLPRHGRATALGDCRRMGLHPPWRRRRSSIRQARSTSR